MWPGHSEKLDLSGFGRRAQTEGPLRNPLPCSFQACPFHLRQRKKSRIFAKQTANVPFPGPSRKTKLPFLSEAAECVRYLSGTCSWQLGGKDCFPKMFTFVLVFMYFNSDHKQTFQESRCHSPHTEINGNGDRPDSSCPEETSDLRGAALVAVGIQRTQAL